jgi:pyruvate dehydrogenase E1 component beta subunit
MTGDSSKLISHVIRDAQEKLLEEYPESLLFGLGVNDPKRVFGTTQQLVEKFGKARVFETPTAENSSLGIALGLSISGFKPIVVHQRLDFFLLAMDQLVNAAAKWRFMFGDTFNTSMIIRLIVGRGWGQGPTHSQNLHSWFAHIPNLRVLYPTFAEDFEMMYSHAFKQPYPVIVLEDRWVHQSKARTAETPENKKWGTARIVQKGKDLTLITFGFNTLLGIKVVHFLEKFGISVELIDLVSLKPIDWETIYASVSVTQRLVVVDSGFEIASLGSYISDSVNRKMFGLIKSPTMVCTAGDYAEPTSYGVIGDVKINAITIAKAVVKSMNMNLKVNYDELKPQWVDVPDSSFQGPF